LVASQSADQHWVEQQLELVYFLINNKIEKNKEFPMKKFIQNLPRAFSSRAS
jgi:hypothetical protein